VPVDVRRSAERFTTARPGSQTRYCFSFGHHYDPANVGFGPVVAVNDEVVDPGAGFDDHKHAGLVIVTYVVHGSLVHQGISTRTVSAGEVAVLRTGGGVVHAERNAGPGELRLVQTWLTTDSPETSYGVIAGPVVGEGWRCEVLSVAPQSACEVRGHVFVVSGRLEDVCEGDSLRLTSPMTLTAAEATTLLTVTW
jgi:hypothetical protein